MGSQTVRLRDAFVREFPQWGIWPLHVWLLVGNMAFAAQPVLPSPALNSYAFLFLFMIAAAFAFRRCPSDSRVRKFDYPIGILMVVDGIVLAAGLFVDLPLGVRIAEMVVRSIGVCWGYLRWGFFYALMDTKSAVGTIAASAIVGCLVKCAFFLIPFAIAAFIVAVFPLLSFAFLHLALKGCGESTQSDGSLGYRTADDYLALWRLAASVGITTVIALIGDGFAGQALLDAEGSGVFLGVRAVDRLLIAAFFAGFLMWVFRAGKSLSFMHLWSAIVLCVASGLVLIAFSENVALVGIGYALLDMSVELIILFYWSSLADIAHHSAHSPYTVFGIGWSVYALAHYAGAAIPALMPSGRLEPIPLLLLVFILLVVVVVVLGPSNVQMRRIFADLTDDNPEPQDFATIDERCAALVEAYALTPRELEIMQLLAKGRSKAFIAESLFISESTVRGHSRRLYAKLNVHSRQELQSLIGI